MAAITKRKKEKEKKERKKEIKERMNIERRREIILGHLKIES